MLNEYELPRYFWAKAMNTACYVINRVHLRRDKMKAPYEIWKGYSTNSKAYRVFNSRTKFVEEVQDG